MRYVQNQGETKVSKTDYPSLMGWTGESRVNITLYFNIHLYLKVAHTQFEINRKNGEIT
jgi:hypothetical protein